MVKKAEKRKSFLKLCLHRVIRLACILEITAIGVVIGFGYSVMYLLISNNQHPHQEKILNALFQLLSVTFLGALSITLSLFYAIMFELFDMTEIDEEATEKGIVRGFLLNWILFMVAYVVVTTGAAVIGLWFFGL